MSRRDFLTATPLGLLSLPLMMSMLSEHAGAKTGAVSSTVRDLAIEIGGFNFSDDDNDYLSWAGTAIRSKILWSPGDAPLNEAVCRLIRFTTAKRPDGTGVTVPRHLHPQGELTCVLAGSFIQVKSVNPDGTPSAYAEYQRGDVIWMPAGSVHEAATANDRGATILSFTPKNVDFKI